MRDNICFNRYCQDGNYWIRGSYQQEQQQDQSTAGAQSPIPIRTIGPILAVAIVRVHDYHIDWIDPDGSRRSSPKMPINGKRYSDAERAQRVDSIRKVADDQIERARRRRAGARRRSRFDLGIAPDSEFPTFRPPIQPGTVIADLDGHLWILPTTSTNVTNGLTYDVVNRSGEIIERACSSRRITSWLGLGRTTSCISRRPTERRPTSSARCSWVHRNEREAGPR